MKSPIAVAILKHWNAAMIDLESELRRLHGASFQWALHCTGGRREDAEDALQGAYEALVDGSAGFKGRSSFKSFLFGIIRNKARTLRRKKKVGRLIGLDSVDAPQVDPVGATEVELAQRRQAIRRALKELSPKQRDVLELVFYHDLTIEEAAQVMGLRLGTARTHYKRGKNRMSQQLSQRGLQWVTEKISS